MNILIKDLKVIVKEIRVNVKNLIKWYLLASLIGIFIGSISALFTVLDVRASEFREFHNEIVFLLPISGILIVFLYHLAGIQKPRGTNLVISTIQAKADLGFRVAPLIFISTIITHLFGGSVGREGAALQLGGSAIAGISKIKIFNISPEDRRMMIMCGMSAAFSAIFGTRIAAVFFPMEVISVGIMQYSAMFPCFIASYTASLIPQALGIENEVLGEVVRLEIIPLNMWKIGILAIGCGLISAAFCIMLKKGEFLAEKLFRNQYVRIVALGSLFVLVNYLLGTSDYLGSGMNVIERIMSDGIGSLAFLFKMLLTTICISAGFKGGEIVPALFIGAAFGSTSSNLLNIPNSLGVACGMAALFVGVTNCPITAFLIVSELFGFSEISLYFLLAITVSYVMSGYFGLFSAQNIIYSKFKTKYINRKPGEYDEELEK